MTSFGEGASIIGSAAGLKEQDLVYTQYREQGAHYWRGYGIDQIINQCIGNSEDVGRGRQMPVHYGSKKYNNVTVSSPLSKRFYLFQPPKFLRPQAQDIHIELPNKIR